MPPTPAQPAPPKRSRRRLVILIVAALVAVAVVVVGVQLTLGALNAHAAVRYTSKAEHYSVKAPGKPTREKVKLGGLIPNTSTQWTDGNRYYSVSSSPGGMPPSLQGMFLDGALREALKNAPGVTASALKSLDDNKVFSGQPEEIKLSGAPAYRIKFTVKGAPAPFHLVFTGHGQLLYMVVYSADNRDKDFVDSFKYVG